MRISYRQIFIILFLLAAASVAGVRVAHGQTINNPSAFEFNSADHSNANLAAYRVCFYTAATATTAFRCNDVPKAQAVVVDAAVGLVRLPRATWQTGLTVSTGTTQVTYWFKVTSLGPNGEASAEVAPDTAPFSFKLVPPAPAPVTSVHLVP